MSAEAELTLADEWFRAINQAMGEHRYTAPFVDDAVGILAMKYDELVEAAGALTPNRLRLLLAAVRQGWQHGDVVPGSKLDQALTFIHTPRRAQPADDAARLRVACPETWDAKRSCHAWTDAPWVHACGLKPEHDGAHRCLCGIKRAPSDLEVAGTASPGGDGEGGSQPLPRAEGP